DPGRRFLRGHHFALAGQAHPDTEICCVQGVEQGVDGARALACSAGAEGCVSLRRGHRPWDLPHADIHPDGCADAKQPVLLSRTTTAVYIDIAYADRLAELTFEARAWWCIAMASLLLLFIFIVRAGRRWPLQDRY